MPKKKSRSSKRSDSRKSKDKQGTEEALISRVEASFGLRETYMRKMDSVVTGVHRRFKDFESGAKKDLIFLLEKGADPNVIINIMLVNFWSSSGADEHATELHAAMKRYSSAGFWRKTRKNSEKLSVLISSFMQTRLYEISAMFDFWTAGHREAYPFIRVCKEMHSVAQSLERLLNSISELGLEEGWDLEMDTGLPQIIKSGRSGRKRSGAPKQFDWGQCALELWLYLKARTGAPHWAQIAQLLHHAGCRDFLGDDALGNGSDLASPRIRKDEIDKLRKRVEILRMDKQAMYMASARLRECGVSFGTRPRNR